MNYVFFSLELLYPLLKAGYCIDIQVMKKIIERQKNGEKECNQVRSKDV